MATLTDLNKQTESKATGKTTYRLKESVRAKYPKITSLVPVNLSEKVGGKVSVVSVALSGEDTEIEIPATLTRPAYRRQIKGASQEQLKYLYQVEKNPNIEAVEE